MSFNIHSFKKDNNEVEFIIDDLHFSYINSLRRSILQDISTYGFLNENINIKSNNSMLNNQFLSHRISLLPLHNPNKLPLQDYVFTINKQNNENTVGVVTTDDFVIRHKNNGDIINTNDIFPHDDITGDPILLVKLNPRRYNETVYMECVPTLGTGKDNAAFQCTSQSTYKFVVDKDRAEEEFAKLINDDMSEEEISDIRRKFDTLDIKRCYYIDEKNNPSKTKFMIESIGPIPPENIPILASRSIIERINKLEMELSKVDSNTVLFQKSKKHKNAVIIKLINEDDTIANIIKHYIYEHYVETGKFSYIGYKRSHMLRDDVTIKVISENGEINEVKAILKETFEKLKEIYTMFSQKYRESVIVPQD